MCRTVQPWNMRGLRDIFDDGVAQDIIEETASILGVKGY